MRKIMLVMAFLPLLVFFTNDPRVGQVTHGRKHAPRAGLIHENPTKNISSPLHPMLIWHLADDMTLHFLQLQY